MKPYRLSEPMNMCGNLAWGAAEKLLHSTYSFMAKGTQQPHKLTTRSSLLEIGVVVTRALKGRKPVDESPLLLLIHIQTLAPSKNR